MSNLVSTEWLAAHLKDVRVVDASWYMPDEKRQPAKEFEAGHIPGAVFFDIDAIADTSSGLPHMLPSVDQFAGAGSRLGLGGSEPLVIYDGTGIFSAPRVWWTLRAFGRDDVFVLDGGFPKWKREGHPVETGPASPKPTPFLAFPPQKTVRTFDQVLGIVKDNSAQVLDARSPGRFKAEEPEPRAGVRGGHMPGALNVHYRKLIADDGTLQPPQVLRTVFGAVDLERPVVTSCGSGLTAAILMLGLDEIGAKDVAVYDGSWTEWGGRPEAPVVTG